MDKDHENYVNNDSKKGNKIDKSTFYYLSTIVALVMTMPGLITLITMRVYTDNLILQLSITLFVILISLIFSIKIAKLLSIRVENKQFK
ncbi:MAG: hypothetical protein M3M88_01435 [Thermoproteota archaeon]|nr:hypothetical protein [Thermoproteota archaeon]